MTYDVKITLNNIGGRQGFAYICNSGKYPVLKVDHDIKQEYDDFFKYGKVKVAYNTKFHGELTKVGTLEYFDGKYKVGSAGCFLSNSFGYADAMELIDDAQLPVIREGQIVCLAVFGKTLGGVMLSLYRVGKIDSTCQVVTVFEPLTDEEMTQVKADCIKWLNR